MGRVKWLDRWSTRLAVEDRELTFSHKLVDLSYRENL